MKKIIIANWKMNPATAKEAQQLATRIQQGTSGISDIKVVICPPFPYLSSLGNKGNQNYISLGGQDCFYEMRGSYTGAVSPLMLKDLGCEYVILGHSERKQYFGETNEIINKKLKASLKAGLDIILCIGEESRDSFDSKGKWMRELDPKVKEQLVLALRDVKKSQVKNIVVAYEPIWAIGTGSPATSDDVLSVKIFVKKILSELYDRKIADATKVLYGGSTNKKNTASFVGDEGVDGLLVGGSSLDSEEFSAMVKAISEVS
jgi:triosephosphate isomerase (TIM)